MAEYIRKWWDSLTERQRDDIRLCEHYAQNPFGCDGHNRMVTVSDMAKILDELEWMKEQNSK